MSDGAGDGLNRAQRTAVSTLSGPLLVLAGAGTGKTRVITYRIAELIRSGITPHRILAVTFTNKAAREMRERASTLLGKRRRKKGKQKGPEISTFHSLCVRVLRRNAKVLGYPDNFTIYDRGDQESVARSALRDIRVGAQKLRPGDLIHQISSWKSSGLTPAEAQSIAVKDVEILAAQAYEKYQISLRTSGAMDFDDLLSMTERLLDKHPEVRFAEASRFDHILIDEYQDTSGVQYRIVRALAERHRNICVVGDDDQSIYGWRGAEVEHILGFRDQWSDAKVVRLEENYRSTGWILHLANTLIRHNSVRHDKVLKPARSSGDPPRFVPYQDENHEAEAVVSEIFRRINQEGEERTKASDIAILFRTNEQPRAFEQEMRRAGVPYRLVGGLSFYDRKEIKDLLSYLRILANPHDEVSLLRIINTPPRGIGPSGIKVLLDEAVSQGAPLWRLLEAAPTHPDVPSGAAAAIFEFRQTMDEFRSRVGTIPLVDLLIELIDRVNYKAELERQYKDPSEQETRWNAVQELVNAISTYEGREEEPTLQGFLEESSLSDREEDKDDDERREHAVTLMTLHSAKGLEFPHVYLVGLEEGLLPHKRSLLEDVNTIPEERRLAYVGVTRAQDTLTLSFCKTRMKWGKSRNQIPSRFLMEMRGETEKANAIAAQSEEHFEKEKERALKAEEKKEGTKKPRKRREAQDRDPRPVVPVPPPPPMPKKKSEAPSPPAPVAAAPVATAPPEPRRPEPPRIAKPVAPNVTRATTRRPIEPAPVVDRTPAPPDRSPSPSAPQATPDAPGRGSVRTNATRPVAQPAAAPEAPRPRAAPEQRRSSADFRQVGLFGDEL